MKNIKNWKKLMTLTGIAYFSFAALFSPSFTLTAQAANSDAIVDPCADVYEWRFKVENGKLYKRLYNVTANEWAGNWIYVSEAS